MITSAGVCTFKLSLDQPITNNRGRIITALNPKRKMNSANGPAAPIMCMLILKYLLINITMNVFEI